MVRKLAVAATLALFACAPTNPKIGTTEITSAAVLRSYRESERAAEELGRDRNAEALALAEHAVLLAPNNAYARYDLAVALGQLRRTDAAVTTFHQAEALFGTDDKQGKAISIYGRARVLDDVGRCAEARAAYGEYATFVSSFAPAAANMARAYAEECRPAEPAIGDAAMTDLVTAVITHEWQNALDASEKVGKPARGSGWIDYDRAIALAGLGRIDDAVAAYRAAEDRFASEPKNRAIAVYGRARVLDQAQRCAQAREAYDEYADLVRESSPDDAAMATKIARTCLR